MTKTEAIKNVGGLSNPGKMPGKAWSISATECIRGSKLQKVAGSVCSSCYACKNRYNFSNVKKSLSNRLEQYKNNSYLWKKSMKQLIKNEKFFRWFDSGDLQSVTMLEDIVEICNDTPDTRHWLPTRERGILKKYIESHGAFPDNLCVRLSADMVNSYPAVIVEGCNISTVSSGVFSDTSMNTDINDCPVSFNKNIKTCEEAKCTSCWDKDKFHVNYKSH